jgi:hypothetical protein
MSAAIVAMIAQLQREPLAELERALAAKLAPRRAPADRRREEFALLSELVDGWDGRGRSPVKRALYDEVSTADDPPSKSLVRRHGSWVDACQAALAAPSESDGAQPRQPWVTARIGQPRPANYTSEEVIRAYLECWRAIGREPTSNVFYSWVAERRRRARESGAPVPRLPTQRSVERHFTSWADLQAAARAESQ